MARPRFSFRVFAARFALAAIAVFVAIFAFDFVYTIFVLGAGISNYWLDRAHIPRAYSAPDPELGFVRKPHLVSRRVSPGALRSAAPLPAKPPGPNSTPGRS